MTIETTQPITGQPAKVLAEIARGTLRAVGYGDVPGLVLVHEDGTADVVSLGEGLGGHTRAGAVMARSLCHQKGAQVLVAIQPPGRRTAAARDAAERILSASRLVDALLERVVLVFNSGRTEVFTR